jgi:hypothetical protein
MELVPYLGVFLFNIALAGLGCSSLTILVVLLLVRFLMPDLFSRLPKVLRNAFLVISLVLLASMVTIGLFEFSTVRENLFWASQPRVCLQAPFRDQYLLQIANHRDGYLGTLVDRVGSDARVKAISEYAVVGHYLVGGSGLSSPSYFIFDLDTGQYHPEPSRPALNSELDKRGIRDAYVLTPILDYCSVTTCSACDE